MNETFYLSDLQGMGELVIFNTVHRSDLQDSILFLLNVIWWWCVCVCVCVCVFDKLDMNYLNTWMTSVKNGYMVILLKTKINSKGLSLSLKRNSKYPEKNCQNQPYMQTSQRIPVISQALSQEKVANPL